MPKSKPITIAFQGVSGAYGEMAAIQVAEHNGREPRCEGLRTFHEVFTAVRTGKVDLGVVPVENSLAGAIYQNFDLLLETDLHVAREVVVRVSHCLMALPGVKLEDVRRVFSHPQALAQCDGFLASHNLRPIEAFDTAGSALELKERGARDEAVIASRRASELYGLEILQAGIEDESFNFTRFFVLSRSESERPLSENLADERFKTSLVFAVRHKPGALVESLACLEGLNMTKIESRPRRDRAWSYVFYVDVEGHATDPDVSAALVRLLQKATFVKVLGSYPTALEINAD
jgi:prephenate dehydratase